MQEASPPPRYEVYAIQFGGHPRRRRLNFFPADDHDGPMPLNYYVWLIRSPARIVLVDTGFGAEAAARRGRGRTRCPIETLGAFGIGPGDVEDVVITHMHYDHGGNLDKLPSARFHIQQAEVAYATGPCMCYPLVRNPYSVEDVTELIQNVYRERVVFHRGDETLVPGIELRLLGGHTEGLQCVRVHTERGWVVLASDGAHYYENFERRNPFPIVANMGRTIQAFSALGRLASSPNHIVPGHDPLVLERYPQVFAHDPGIVALHRDPVIVAVAALSNSAQIP